MNIINKSNLVINSFAEINEGIAICQIKDSNGKIIDEKHFFLTNDPTELIDYRFEGYDQVFIDTHINNTERYCGPDENIEYIKEDIADFHIDFVQHFEHIRQHSNYIQFQNIKHENEGYYECIVRLNNGLVGVRVYFLSVGGNPREISNRELHIYSEITDTITLLCPIFSALPAWYTFIIPKDSSQGVSSLTGYDYLRIKNISNIHSGIYTCRVTTTDDNQGYSLTSNIYLDIYGPPYYIEPNNNEYVLIKIKRNIENILHCSINGNPIPSHQWFLGDIKILNKEKIISNTITYKIIPMINDESELNQTITCIAKNNRGTLRQVFTLEFIN
ncbi:unnamed protein product [Adineta steineri]|uniref:Immunoglobulin domain-containing protein n=1 Tax=Adineta steineri TaxID=433720 RepID=A0A818TWB4_9BILA|nr:unnamed protein product [Adineta steineri]CAF3692982.1 unnamed protein product [Adineta steineri]